MTINPNALRKAKIAHNFGLFECNRVKVNEYIFRGTNSAIFAFASLLTEGQILKKRTDTLGENSFRISPILA